MRTRHAVSLQFVVYHSVGANFVRPQATIKKFDYNEAKLPIMYNSGRCGHRPLQFNVTAHKFDVGIVPYNLFRVKRNKLLFGELYSFFVVEKNVFPVVVSDNVVALIFSADCMNRILTKSNPLCRTF